MKNLFLQALVALALAAGLSAALSCSDSCDNPPPSCVAACAGSAAGQHGAATATAAAAATAAKNTLQPAEEPALTVEPHVEVNLHVSPEEHKPKNGNLTVIRNQNIHEDDWDVKRPPVLDELLKDVDKHLLATPREIEAAPQMKIDPYQARVVPGYEDVDCSSAPDCDALRRFGCFTKSGKCGWCKFGYESGSQTHTESNTRCRARCMDCGYLNRHQCRQEGVCGPCKRGFSGDAGDSNTPCYVPGKEPPAVPAALPQSTLCAYAPDCAKLQRQPCSSTKDTCGRCLPGFMSAQPALDGNLACYKPCPDCESLNRVSCRTPGQCGPCKGGWFGAEEGNSICTKPPLPQTCEQTRQDAESSPSCTMAKADVIMVLDRSGSMGNDGVRDAMEWGEELAEKLDIDEDAVRMGVIFFDRSVDVDLELEGSKSKVLKFFRDGKRKGSGTNIEAGLVAAADMIRRSARPDVPVVVVFMTDGRASVCSNTSGLDRKEKDKRCSEQVSQRARELLATGAEVFSVGVGNRLDDETMHNVATSIEHMLRVGSPGDLLGVVNKLSQKICAAAKAETCAASS